jgi:predicted acetyltransferase
MDDMQTPGPDDISTIEMADDVLRLQFVGLKRHPVHNVPTYYFAMLSVLTNEEVGSINVRNATSRHIDFYAGHIGYSVDAAWRGRRYAARALRLLFPFVRSLGIRPLWITCDPENVASRRTAELAGAEFAGIVDVPDHCIIFKAGHPRKCRYRIDLEAANAT